MGPIGCPETSMRIVNTRCVITQNSVVLTHRGGTLQSRKAMRLLAHGDYSSIADCRTKILAIFRGMFVTVYGISK